MTNIGPTELQRYRAYGLLWIIGLYLILDSGFILVRFPPRGIGLPVTEILIALFLATFLLELRHLRTFATIGPVTPMAIIFVVGAIRLALGIHEHGIWAVRDASHMMNIAFLWIGFVVAATPGFLDLFPRAIRTLAIIGLLYALLYPLRDQLAALSPMLSAPAGYQLPLAFNYSSGSVWSMSAATYLLVSRFKIFGVSAGWIGGMMILYCIVIYQMRSSYLQFAAILLLLLAFRPNALGRLSVGAVVGACVLAVILMSGIEITGRLGAKFSLEFLSKHLLSIFGIGAGGEGEVASAASGFAQRVGWWTKIADDLMQSPARLWFGLGYGVPLTDFETPTGAIVREPHNSLISFTARLGLVGLIALVWLHLVLAWRWLGLFRFTRQVGDREWTAVLLGQMAFVLSIYMFSIGEDAFEKPYNAVPFYFFWGVVLRAAYAAKSVQATNRRQAHAGPAAIAVPRRGTLRARAEG